MNTGNNGMSHDKKKYSGEDFRTRQQMADRVKTLRKAQGMTQAELAKNAGVSRQTISTLENGTSVPQAATLANILEVLGVEVEEVRFDTATEKWLVTIGTMIETIPNDRRAEAVTKVVGVLATEISNNRNNVTEFPDVSSRTDTQYKAASHDWGEGLDESDS